MPKPGPKIAKNEGKCEVATVSVPKKILERTRRLALQRRVTWSKLVTDALRELK